MARKTVMRSVRISRELDDVLRRDSESRGISFSSLVSEIFTKYSEWDRLASRFGMVNLPRGAFREMWETIGKEKAVSMGKEAGSKTATEGASFWFKGLNTGTFLKLVELTAKYAKTFEYELESKDGREYTITVHHEINETYSVFLENWFESAIKAFVGVTPSKRVSPYSVVMTFREPQS